MEAIANWFLIFFASEEFEIIVKVIVAIILSGIIGTEREMSSKPAGLRTNVLVGVSATLIMALGIFLAEADSRIDASRMAAQLLSGIGFIGAGTILRNGFNVKGLTTAAGLLAVTCIGLFVGAGYYVSAIIITLLVLFILKNAHKFIRERGKKTIFMFRIFLDNPSEKMAELKNLLNEKNLEVTKIRIVETEAQEEGKFIAVEFRSKLSENDNNDLVFAFTERLGAKQVIEE